MRKQIIQTSSLVLIGLLLLASVPAINAQSENNYYVSMENVDAKQESVDSLKNVKSFNSATFTIKPTEFNNAVNENKIIILQLMGEDVALDLHETHVMGDDTKVITTDEKGNMVLVDAPDIRTYHGKVVGDEDSQVAITISNNLLAGMIDVDDNAYYIDVTKNEIGGKNIHIVYRAESVEFDLTDGLLNDTDEGVDYDSRFEYYETSDNLVLTSRAMTSIKILPCYDRHFKNIYGSYALAEFEIADMINTANLGLDDHDASLTFDYYKRYSYLDSGTGQEIINFFKNDISPYRDITGSDLATLFYGQDFEDTVLGMGSTYNGSSVQAYSVLQMVAGTGSYGATYPERCIVLTHEIGHNLDSRHNEHYEWIATPYTYYTVMSPSVIYNSTHRVRTVFSDGDVYGDATHNNGAHIEACKDIVAAFRT